MSIDASTMPDDSAPAQTLLDHLARQVATDRIAYRFLDGAEGEPLALSWRDLDRQASALAGHLCQVCPAGARVVLVLPTGPEFIIALVACWKAALVAVPIEPPRPRRRPERLAGVISDCRPALVLTAGDLIRQVQGAVPIDGPTVAAIGQFSDDSPPVLPLRPPCALALLQYTSGSTGVPKGVRITHGNFISNARVIAERFQLTPETVGLSWLPMFHDMGLVGHVVTPMVVGFTSLLMPTLVFTQRPAYWLQAIHRWRVTVIGAPDIGYRLTASRIQLADVAGCDLSCVRVAYCGAEPVRPDTLAAFERLAGPLGFQSTAWLPCYGLAEATLLVSGRLGAPRVRDLDVDSLESDSVQDATDQSRRRLRVVSCGQPGAGVEVRIADPRTGSWLAEGGLAKGGVGEIRVRSAGVTAGYFRHPDGVRRDGVLVDDPAGGGPWLATGDLGFLDQGELFINGRIKDLIIVHGRNHHPVDLEATASAVAGETILPGRLAAFQDDTEVILLVEPDPRLARRLDPLQARQMREDLRVALAQQHEIAVAVHLVAAGSIPTTSSGKIRRRASCQAWRQGSIPVLRESATPELVAAR